MRRLLAFSFTVFLLASSSATHARASAAVDVLVGYGASVALFSTLALGPMIVVHDKLTQLSRVKSCGQVGDTEECRRVENYKTSALASMASQGVAYGAGLIALTFGACIGRGAVGSNEATAGVGAMTAVVAFGIGTVVSHITALYTDIGLWAEWDEVEKTSASIVTSGQEAKHGILGGSIASGVFHFLPYGGMVTVGAISIARAVRKAIEANSERAEL